MLSEVGDHAAHAGGIARAVAVHGDEVGPAHGRCAAQLGKHTRQLRQRQTHLLGRVALTQRDAIPREGPALTLADGVEVKRDGVRDAQLVGARVPPPDGGAALVDLVLQPGLGQLLAEAAALLRVDRVGGDAAVERQDDGLLRVSVRVSGQREGFGFGLGFGSGRLGSGSGCQGSGSGPGWGSG